MQYIIWDTRTDSINFKEGTVNFLFKVYVKKITKMYVKKWFMVYQWKMVEVKFYLNIGNIEGNASTGIVIFTS